MKSLYSRPLFLLLAISLLCSCAKKSLTDVEGLGEWLGALRKAQNESVTYKEREDAKKSDAAARSFLKKTLIDPIASLGADPEQTIHLWAKKIVAQNFTKQEGVVLLGFWSSYTDEVDALEKTGLIKPETAALIRITAK